MKLKDPAFLFYPEAFMIGTMDMTDEEAGRYIRLMCLQFVKGHLAELTGADDMPKVREKFTLDDEGRYYNRRLQYEMDRRRAFTESRRKNGKKGGRPTKAEEKPTKNHMVNLMETTSKPYGKPSENLPINTNTNTNTDINLSSIREHIREVKERYKDE